MNIMNENAHTELKEVLNRINDSNSLFSTVEAQWNILFLRVLVALVYAILGISSELRNKK